MTKKLTLTILLNLIFSFAAFAQTTEFTYQGRLMDGAMTPTANYDLEFDLYDAVTGGTQLGATDTKLNVAVVNGIFTVQLSFAGQFSGAARFLEIRVRPTGGGAYETLTPRQPVTSAPYAIKSLDADNATTATTATTANNFSGSLSGDVTGTQNATSVANVGGVSATNVASGANAANAATAANTASTIVKRDANGDFTARLVNADGLSLPATSSNIVGVIRLAGNSLMHTQGFHNVFTGIASGNFTMTGTDNTMYGNDSFQDNESGAANTGIGYRVLNENTTGARNTATGLQALLNNTTGSFNTGVGSLSLHANTEGISNTALGNSSLLNTTGSNNIGIGSLGGINLTTGSDNIAIGNAGVAGESGVIRIGTDGFQTSTFIAGINGATSSGGTAVFVDSNGQLGTLTSSRRFKKNIFDMKDSSESIFKLRPVTFLYKPELDKNAIPQWGLIAEEVEKINPDLVIRDANGTIQTVRYEQINAMMLNEFLKEHKRVQTLTEENEAMKLRLAELEKEAKEREARLERLEKLLLTQTDQK